MRTFLRALIPFGRMLPPWPSHFPNIVPSNTIILQVGVSIYEFWRDKRNIQTMVVGECVIYGMNSIKTGCIFDMEKFIKAVLYCRILICKWQMCRERIHQSINGFLWVGVWWEFLFSLLKRNTHFLCEQTESVKTKQPMNLHIWSTASPSSPGRSLSWCFTAFTEVTVCYGLLL